MKDLCYPYNIKLSVVTGFAVVIPIWGKHGGYDFSIKPLIGKPLAQQAIHSPWEGEVLVAKLAGDNSGWYVCIYSAKENVTFVVWHINKKLMVKAGQKVKKGQILGYAETSDYSPAHNHVQFNKGKVTRGSWNSAVLDPQPFFNRMELWSNLTEDPMKIAALEKKVAELTKANNDMQANFNASVATMQYQIDKMITDLNILNGQIHDMNADVLKWKSIAIDIASMVGYILDPVSDWGTQRYGIRERVARIPYDLSYSNLIGIILNKLISRKK